MGRRTLDGVSAQYRKSRPFISQRVCFRAGEKENEMLRKASGTISAHIRSPKRIKPEYTSFFGRNR